MRGTWNWSESKLEWLLASVPVEALRPPKCQVGLFWADNANRQQLDLPCSRLTAVAKASSNVESSILISISFCINTTGSVYLRENPIGHR